MTFEPRPLHTALPRGPHPVGVATLDVEDPDDPQRRLATDVWYPAVAERYERCAPASHPIGQPHDAREGAKPAAGPLPLVAFSHGNSGLRRQSTFLTTHLASWGYVVAAPDHAGNTFFEMIGVDGEDERRRVHLEARARRPRDLGAAIEAVASPSADDAGRWPAVDANRIGVLGHSFGGWTALKMPGRDKRIAAVCGLAPAAEPFVGRKAFEPDELPFEAPIPTLLVAGLDDVLVDVDESVGALYDRLRDPRALVGLRGADHFHFCDGIPLLHGLHERNRRPRQTRAARPYADLLQEARAHDVLRALVASFFLAALPVGGDPAGAALPDLSPAALALLDPALERLGASA